MVKQFNLSQEKITDKILEYVYSQAVIKEFLNKENDLINKLILKEITWQTFRIRRKKLIGGDLL